MKSFRKILTISIASAMLLTPIAAEAGNYHRYHHHHYKKIKAPPTSHGIKTPAWATYMGWAGGCSIVWLLLASTKKGGPTPLEAQMIVGNCFLPFFGGYLVEQAYKKNNNIQ